MYPKGIDDYRSPPPATASSTHQIAKASPTSACSMGRRPRLWTPVRPRTIRSIDNDQLASYLQPAPGYNGDTQLPSKPPLAPSHLTPNLTPHPPPKF